MIKTANKRMFSLAVVDTDVFLEMPTSAQALYFHLCLRADDDGFVGSAKRICRAVGANEDDLKLLIAKRFVLIFDDGVIVIKHWRMHNTLSATRYKETNFLEDKALLRIKPNNAYTLGDKGEPLNDEKLIETSKRQTIDEQKTNNRRAKDEQKTNNRQTIDEQKTNNRRAKDDTDKIRIDKNRIEENREEEKKNKKRFESEHLEKAFNDYLEYRKEINCMLTDRGIELTIEKLKKLSNGNEETAIKIINQTIAKGWKDIYQFKETPSKSANDIQRDMSYQEIKDLETQLLRS